jgi:acyl-homoserine lactone acylase PvdQ
VDDSAQKLQALIDAASRLTAKHGDWRVRWGDVSRMQRHVDCADLTHIPFDDRRESLPCLGGHGPMGIVFTQYYTPSIHVPGVISLKRRYGVVGATYLSVVEFAPRVAARTLVQFGAASDAQSPHYLDQAALLSERKLKREVFDWDEIQSTAVLAYRPGEQRIARNPTAPKP